MFDHSHQSVLAYGADTAGEDLAEVSLELSPSSRCCSTAGRCSLLGALGDYSI